jgi:hypothetical protein
MRKLLVGAGVLLAFVLGAGPGAALAAASSGDVSTLPQPKPGWLTPGLEAKILAAGSKGVEVRFDKGTTIEPNCLGTAPPHAGTDGVSATAVSAGTCMVSPEGCTMNFVFTDGISNYIGTAGHCAGGGKTVIAQIGVRVDPTNTIVTLAAIGSVVKSVNNGIGRDFALVKINPAFKVDPGVAGALGPTGVLCGDPVGQPVMHYGHGYIFFVEQGYPKFGEVIPDLNAVFKFTSTQYGFNWVGYGLPGDSGSDVMNDAGLAVGDLTHGLAPAGVPVPGLNFGTDMDGIFNIIGTSYKLVTVDGRRADCSKPLGV